MNRLLLCLLSIICWSCTMANQSGPTVGRGASAYPPTATVAQVDDYFGTEILDPYRWLEQDVREAPAVSQWVSAQNAVSQRYLNALPGRDKIVQRLKTLWDYEKFTLPTKAGGRYFFRRNDGLQNQYSLYMQTALDAEPVLLIDPNTWSEDGATALDDAEPSPDGKYLAYSVQDGGSDWRTIKVLDVDSGTTLAETLQWIKFSDLAWAPDGSGFYYSRFPEPAAGAEFQSLNYNQAVYFHTLNTPQTEDRLVFSRPDDPTIGFYASVIGERYLSIIMVRGTDNRYEVAVQDLTKPNSQPQMLVRGFEHDYTPFGASGDTLYVFTDADAPKGRIIAIDLTQPEPDNWREIVPEADAVLTSASLVGGTLIANYLQDVATQILRFDLTGTALGAIELPGLGSAAGFAGELGDTETFYQFESYNLPPTLYRYNIATGASEIFKAPTTPFDPALYTVERQFYTGKDGTRIPIFLSYRKNIDRKTTNPTLLYGYGGFGVSLEPRFSITRLAWMEMGGVYAVANLRGGGEYGKTWHDAGRLLNKQNVFDDFIAAAEFLIANNITSNQQLAIYGGSNGGLLVGAVTNQRPDLFAAAVPAVGVMDMLRFDKFTAGRYWVDDYGKPSENPADFTNNYAYSPYHNIKNGADYPAILVTTADTDDRVVPGHSFKYIAALQAADTGPEPKLIRVETRAGHGAGKPTEKVIEEYGDVWGFLGFHTGLQLAADD